MHKQAGLLFFADLLGAICGLVLSDKESLRCVPFADTDFVGTDGQGGGKFKDSGQLAAAIDASWPNGKSVQKKYVVCTGGEPLLQLDASLIDALHAHGFEVAVETNGTIEVPPGVDWVCVSPKGSSTIVQNHGDEIKLVYPQLEEEAAPNRFEDLDFTHKYLQPMDSPQLQDNVKATIEYCMQNPDWKLSIQTHKIVGID